jgi:hypothetical protein
MNMVQIMYTHVCKCKIIPVESVEGRWKREVEGVYSSIVYLIHYKNLCKCYNVPTLNTTIKTIHFSQACFVCPNHCLLSSKHPFSLWGLEISLQITDNLSQTIPVHPPTPNTHIHFFDSINLMFHKTRTIQFADGHAAWCSYDCLCAEQICIIHLFIYLANIILYCRQCFWHCRWNYK